MACQSCQQRHYKCDKQLATCGRCQQDGLPCERKRRRIRLQAARDQFDGQETWVALPARVDFVDESRKTAATARHRAVLKEKRRSSVPQLGSPANGQKRDRHEPLPSDTLVPPSQPNVICHPHNIQVPSSPPSHRTTDSSSSFRISPSSWPLQTSQEAYLTRHFVDHVSCFFDFCDPDRHFAREVPQRARNNRTLACAVFAISARHLSRTGQFDHLLADHYYQECLERLIPALGQSEAIMDDALLAALVVLRLLEEIDVPIAGSDLQGHLIGTQAIILEYEKYKHEPISGLRKAACWAAFRQELYICLKTSRPVKLVIDCPSLVGTSEGVDDWTWASYAVSHCRDVLDFAYGSGPRDSKQYQKLVQENMNWRTQQQPSFNPFFVGEEGSAPGCMQSPDVRLHLDCHVMGHQYNLLAHMLLVIFDPNIPRAGPLHKEAVRKVDEQARADVSMICGISISNKHTPPAMLLASMAIGLCGDRFTMNEEQKGLEEILLQTEELHGWPTAGFLHDLRKAWGRQASP